MGATKTKTPTASVTVAKFTDSHQPFTVMRDKQKLAAFEPCAHGDYLARGVNTPLRDATARFIRHLDELQHKNKVVIGLLADESGSMGGREDGVIQGINEFVAGMSDVAAIDPKAAGKVLCVIITDGLENASQEITAPQLQTLIKEREHKGWTFIYLGANQDAWSAGTSYGLSGTHSGQTVTMQSNSSKAFGSALKRTGSTYGAAYLSENDSFVGMASAMPNRTIDEDGSETASDTAPEPEPVQTYGDIADALKKAKGATQ